MKLYSFTARSLVVVRYDIFNYLFGSLRRKALEFDALDLGGLAGFEYDATLRNSENGSDELGNFLVGFTVNRSGMHPQLECSIHYAVKANGG